MKCSAAVTGQVFIRAAGEMLAGETGQSFVLQAGRAPCSQLLTAWLEAVLSKPSVALQSEEKTGETYPTILRKSCQTDRRCQGGTVPEHERQKMGIPAQVQPRHQNSPMIHWPILLLHTDRPFFTNCHYVTGTLELPTQRLRQIQKGPHKASPLLPISALNRRFTSRPFSRSVLHIDVLHTVRKVSTNPPRAPDPGQRVWAN